MENNEQNRDKLLDYLELIRDNQALKSPNEIDRELLDGTVSMLLKLQNKDIDLSIEEVKERVRKIPFVKTPDFEGESQKKRKKINKRKILLIAAIIAILCTLLTIISSGYDFDDIHRIMREKFGSVFSVPVGEIQTEGNYDFINQGKSKIYTNKQDFFTHEDYKVLLPSTLPDQIVIVDILLISENNEIIVSFNEHITSYEILLNKTIPEVVKENAYEHKTVNKLLCFINKVEHAGIVQIHFEHNGNYYVIGGTDEQILLNIIENLEEN